MKLEQPVKNNMIKKSTLSIISISFFALSACSPDGPDVSEKLRKVGSPIQGTWQIADFDTCNPEKKDRNITITSADIQFSNEDANASFTLLENMKQLKSNKYMMLSGVLNLNNTKNQRVLAYWDEGDRLIFKGFFIDNKLLSRKKIIELYNEDGKAERNTEILDFNFCGS